MRISARIVKTFEDADNLKAVSIVYFNNDFIVRSVKICEFQKELTIFMPSVKNHNGECNSVCFPISPDFQAKLTNAVLNAYDRHVKETETDEK